MLSGRDHNVRYLGAAKTHYTAFVRGYLNEAAVMVARNRSYPGRGGGWLSHLHAGQ
jgi:hypothetical protein